ncbi:MAG: tetratricopeptide repeat protein [Thaumarchaeota archaeon]|nr:tetratricopeptide repeat protein [Nitrososphaerota archaeon]
MPSTSPKWFNCPDTILLFVLLASGERRLAAVTFVDLVGYTQLSQRNEELALRHLEEYRSILRPLFARHNGNEVKTLGDGFLVEFPSALEAVRSAFEIQQSLHDLNSVRQQDKRVLARIGIHVGDVIHSGSDIYGDAVNIASRIEPLADPGGICISQPVHTQVRNKFEFPIKSIGVRALKNVDLPMEVFKVTLPWDQSSASEVPFAPKTRIAILPFSNISPDTSDEYFADGMTEELINTISHNHQLKVIARTTVGRYKGSQKSISEIAKEIGVGSVLEGSVRKAGNKIRVTAQLIDATTEDHMWSDNYDRQLDDVFSIQSEIAKSVSEALMARLIPEEQKSIEKKTPASSAAYVRYLKGRMALRDRTEAGMREAKKLFEAAIVEDPNYAEAYAGLADAFFLLGNYDHMPTAEANKRGKESLDKALSLDNGLSEAHNTLAQFLTADYRFAEAEREFLVAIKLSPNYSLAHHWYGICLMETGNVEKSIEETRIAAELDPLSAALASNMAYNYAKIGDEGESQKWIQKLKELDTTNQFFDFIMALISEAKGDFDAAAAYADEALRRHPSNNGYMSELGFYNALLGRREKVEEILQKLNELPDDTYGKPFNLAIVHAGLGDKDEMFRYLDQAFNERSILFRVLRYAHFDPSIREDPRYASLFQRANLRP